jgi:hypothetical protein
MVAVVESVVAISLVVTIAAIISAHHIEKRLEQRWVEDGNQYHRFDYKMFRLRQRFKRDQPPHRFYCPRGHPLD